jgi:hypothetical protein
METGFLLSYRIYTAPAPWPIWGVTRQIIYRDRIYVLYNQDMGLYILKKHALICHSERSEESSAALFSDIKRDSSLRSE